MHHHLDSSPWLFASIVIVGILGFSLIIRLARSLRKADPVEEDGKGRTIRPSTILSLPPSGP